MQGGQSAVGCATDPAGSKANLKRLISITEFEIYTANFSRFRVKEKQRLLLRCRDHNHRCIESKIYLIESVVNYKFEKSLRSTISISADGMSSVAAGASTASERTGGVPFLGNSSDEESGM
jgi:hypothetical protein